MKKIWLFSLLLLIVCAASAQTKFSVPVPTMEQKYNLAKAFMYNNVLVGINVAKSAGMTAEEYSKKCGAVFAPAWNKDMGFDQFVNTVLGHWSCLTDSLKIIEQSDEKVVFTVQRIYPQLENQGVLLGSSFDELVQHWDIVYGAIADYLNLNCKTTKVQKGVEVRITR